MTYAFTFDAKFCSGCKACQAACKDKNNLPVGVLWRRVFEVSGGEWQSCGESWNNSVFAYNLSISCNHCVHPKCAGVCPTNAYVICEDGIVILDTTRCVGCGYCAWACPYGAPQYNPDAGHMTKCDLCVDNIDQGLPPACVAACPMRVLELGDFDGETKGVALWDTAPELHPYPLPTFSHTQPRLAITLHPAMALNETKSIANLDEVQPRPATTRDELPLLIFTLLAQLAVGGFWAMTMMFPLLWQLVEYDATRLKLLPLLIIGASLGAGMVASFAHLGTKRNAWRVLSNIRKSSLSREILFTGLFGSGWIASMIGIFIVPQYTTFTFIVTSLLGFGLVYNMSQVYRFRAAPGWNTWRTNTGFMTSTFLLGTSVMSSVHAYQGILTGIPVPLMNRLPLNGSIVLLLLIQWMVMKKGSWDQILHLTRTGLILAGVLVSIVALLLPDTSAIGTQLYVLAIIVVEEMIGRWVFYQSRLETP